MDHDTIGGRKLRPGWLVAAGLVVVALVALGVPLVSLFYLGVLLLCPLLMMSMHGGGHGHGPDGSAGIQHEPPASARGLIPNDGEEPGPPAEGDRR